MDSCGDTNQLNPRFLGPECGSRGTGPVGEVAVDLSLHLRHDLSSEQVHAFKGEVVRHRADLEQAQHDAGAQLLENISELLAHRGRAAGQDEAAFYEVFPRVLGAHVILAREGAHDILVGTWSDISWREAKLRRQKQEFFHEVPQVRLILLTRLFVSL